jgi:hypothetical protein
MKVVADHDDEIERLRAELAYQRERCQRIMRAHDEQAIALFLLRKGLKKIAIGDGNDPQLVARRYLDRTWLRLHR